MMKHQTRMILAGMMGNLIESYDMAICGLLSIYFAKYLTSDNSTGLLVVFFTFFAGYLARPVGALLLGLFSDIYGRKITLAASVLIMGISTACIGIIPEKSTIGSSSMILLLILRIIQSFSSGAEYINSFTYLVENAEASRKGYAGSWGSFGAMSGLLVASLVILIIRYYMDAHPEVEHILWRLPFLLALLGSSVGLYIRLYVPESLEYIVHYAEHPKPKFASLLRQSLQFVIAHKLKTIYVFVLCALGVVTTFQIYIYAPIQAQLYGYFTNQQILFSNVVSLLVLLLLSPIMGRLSDKLNREKIVLLASAGFGLLSIPFFVCISSNNYVALVLMQVLIAIPASAYYAIGPVILAEMFPINLRCTVLSVLYAIPASLAAGLTPLLSLMLLRYTNMAIAPTLLIFVLIAFVGVVMRKAQHQDKKIGVCFDKIIN